jgi:hypothetical protein
MVTFDIDTEGQAFLVFGECSVDERRLTLRPVGGLSWGLSEDSLIEITFGHME